MKRLVVFIRAVTAGVMIAVGGTVFLSCDNKYLGAFLFSVGLFSIVCQGYALFTGAVGYTLTVGAGGRIDLAVIWVGNLVGTSLSALLIRFTRISVISEKATAMCDSKLNDSPVSIFILAVFCGMLMYLAVDSFRTQKHTLLRIIPVFICVTVFILCGFEHCVANMYYFAIGGAYSGILHGDFKSILYLLIMTLGNGVGAILLDCVKRVSAEAKEKNS